MALRLSQLKKTYRRYPKSILFAHLADLYLHKNQVSRALSLCRAGCEQFPHYATGFTILSRCHQARGDLEEARAAQQRALDLDPENPGGLVRLAEIYHDQGRSAQALESLQQAASLADLSQKAMDLMDRLTYAQRVESTRAGIDGLLDNETQLDALALEMEREEPDGGDSRITEPDPAPGSTPPSANSSDNGTAPGPDAGDQPEAADLAAGGLTDPVEEEAGHAAHLADSAEEADLDFQDGQLADSEEDAACESPKPGDDELLHLFQEIEDREEGEMTAAAAKPASQDPPIATATLAQIYSDQGMVQRAADTYRQVLARDPDNEDIKRRLADLE